MQRRLHGSLTAFFSLVILSAFGQRQELSISPIGFLRPRNQMVQYERYVDSRQSLTVSLSYNDDQRDQLLPTRMVYFSSMRGAIGYRNYFHSVLGEDVMLFGSVRAVVDYSTLQLTSNSIVSIPTDSLQTSGFSLAPEILFGGKITLSNRITLSGALGMQYLFKLFSTDQITRNPTYWSKVFSEDAENWQVNRNEIINHRRGRYPSVQVTVGIVLGKRQ